MIHVTMVAANTYQVAVDGSRGCPTTHRVSLSQEYYRRLSGGTFTHEWVIVQAFRFLLERQPNTDIRPEFDLLEVGSQFNDFESDLTRRLGR